MANNNINKKNGQMISNFSGIICGEKDNFFYNVHEVLPQFSSIMFSLFNRR